MENITVFVLGLITGMIMTAALIAAVACLRCESLEKENKKRIAEMEKREARARMRDERKAR